MALTKDDILKALSRIVDLASRRDVVDAGLVQGLVVREGHVGFSIEVAPERGRTAEPLRKACEDVVSRLPGVLSVTAVLTAHEDMRTKPQGSRPPHAGHSHQQRMGI